MGLKQDIKILSEIVQRFRAGEMDEKEVKELEEQTGKPAENYIRETEELLEKVQYTITTLTITELRGITKRPNDIPQTERQLAMTMNIALTIGKLTGCGKEAQDETTTVFHNRAK